MADAAKTEKFIFPVIPAALNQLTSPREVNSVQSIANTTCTGDVSS